MMKSFFQWRRVCLPCDFTSMRVAGLLNKTALFMDNNNGCEGEGKVVCQSGSGVCVLFVGRGGIIAEFTKQKKGSPQLELH